MTKRGPALIAHGGAGGRAPAHERVSRRRALLDAVDLGAHILREGGRAIDAVIATVTALEDDPFFNAGYGSVLTTEGKVEMDAAVMVAERRDRRAGASDTNAASQPPVRRGQFDVRAGGVVLVSRVRNPILLARAVMDHSPHVLMGGVNAERLAPRAGIRLCRSDELVSDRARERWRALMKGRTIADAEADRHGTVGAAAIDAHGNFAAATSTGGVAGKLPGRVGDSAIVGAGLCADARGAASATGTGEAIIKLALCRDAVLALGRRDPISVAERAIAQFGNITGAQAGVILVDAFGRIGHAHNAEAMEIGTFDAASGVRHLTVEPIGRMPVIDPYDPR